jgi:hypothetical protein
MMCCEYGSLKKLTNVFSPSCVNKLECLFLASLLAEYNRILASWPVCKLRRKGSTVPTVPEKLLANVFSPSCVTISLNVCHWQAFLAYYKRILAGWPVHKLRRKGSAVNTAPENFLANVFPPSCATIS